MSSPSASNQSDVRTRAVCFFDGQNLFRSAQAAFGVEYPDYDPLLLADAVCNQQGWHLVGTRFYTGVPAREDDPHWHEFWSKKLLQLERRRVHIFKRKLQFQDRTTHWPGHVRVRLPNEPEFLGRPRLYLEDGRELPTGTEFRVRTGHEKGVDVRLALDVLSLAYANAYDVAVIFSQDQDLSELPADVRAIAAGQKRPIKLASAFPVGAAGRPPMGIRDTDWVPIDQATYAACVDPRDYRPRPKS